jgi:DNA polymerase I-like protein with 3'-5' exonuclease and polymerase domains
MAIAAACTVHQAELLQSRWFAAHPGIKEWHRRTERQLQTSRMVVNKFGYRRVYFDRIEGLLPEALAWVPQSTVAIYINKIWDAVVTQLKEVQVLMQVHDSLVWQAPTATYESIRLQFKSIASTISIPYDDPLIIPVGFKSSIHSWGDCK